MKERQKERITKLNCNNISFKKDQKKEKKLVNCSFVKRDDHPPSCSCFVQVNVDI
jgi:hypothetical protein